MTLVSIGIFISVYFTIFHYICLLFLDECGIVAQISQPLADSDISAYYISTFSFDHALVSPSARLESAESMGNSNLWAFWTQINIRL